MKNKSTARKKYYAALLTLLLTAAVLLTACGSRGNKSGTAASMTDPAAAPSSDPLSSGAADSDASTPDTDSDHPGIDTSGTALTVSPDAPGLTEADFPERYTFEPDTSQTEPTIMPEQWDPLPPPEAVTEPSEPEAEDIPAPELPPVLEPGPESASETSLAPESVPRPTAPPESVPTPVPEAVPTPAP